MTELLITPDYGKKTAKFSGTVAAGERVLVTVKDAAEWDSQDLRLRVMLPGRTLAMFPVMGVDDVTPSWTLSGSDLVCELSLNTEPMHDAVAGGGERELLVVLEDTESNTLYFRDYCTFLGWPQVKGDRIPYDYTDFPALIDDWTEQLDNMEVSAERVDGGIMVTLWNGKGVKPNAVVINDGPKGPKGETGNKGNGIAKIELVGKNADGDNVYRVTMDDDSIYELTMPRGPKGEQGDVNLGQLNAAVGAEKSRAEARENEIDEKTRENYNSIIAIAQTISGINEVLAGKADTAAVANALEAKANKEDLSGYATEKYVDSKVAEIPAGTQDYNVLRNKPRINGQVLEGDVTTNMLGISEEINGAVSVLYQYLAPIIDRLDEQKRDKTDNFASKDEVEDENIVTKSNEPYVTPTGVKNIATGLVESARHELQGDISAAQSTADNALAMVEEATKGKGYSYKNPLFDELYSLSPVHTVAVNSSTVAIPCHKGWLICCAYGRSASIKDYYIAPDGSITFSDGAIFGGSKNEYHVAVVKPDETVVYATASGGAFIKVIVDKDCNLHREILTDLPFNVATYKNSYGISNGNGFAATTAGIILKDDTFEEVSVFSTTPLYSNSSPSLRTWGSLEYSTKDGRYIYCNPSTKKLTKMKLDEGGVPEFTVNNYVQSFDSNQYPFLFSNNIESDWSCCAIVRERCDGVISGIGNNYDNGLTTVGIGPVHGACRNVKFGYPIICVGDKIVLVTSSSSNGGISESHDLIKDFVPHFDLKSIDKQGYQSLIMAQDRAGNILCLRFQTFWHGNKQLFVILTEK